MNSQRQFTVTAEARSAAQIHGPLGSLAFAAAVIACLTPWVHPPEALALGAVFGLGLGNPHPSFSRKTSKHLLQVCVALLGFSMNLDAVVQAGVRGAVFGAVSIVATLALAYGIGRLLRIERITSMLIGAGTAICGGSAIAAVGSVIAAGEAQMGVALGTVFLLNAAALYLFPAVGHLLDLSQAQFGTWAGIGIHDISSVVGAASGYGQEALQTATAVKLTRALWIIPVAAAASIFSRRNSEEQRSRPRGVAVPWFVGAFLLASTARTFLPGTASLAPTTSLVAEAGLTVCLFLIGAGLSRRHLASVGWRPLVQGVVLWAAISAMGLWAVTFLVT